MANFDEYFPIENQLEGTVYENDADDVGGCTKYGITLIDLVNFYKDKSLNCSHVKAMTRDEAYKVLKGLYWDAYNCSEIPNQSLAEFICDSILNQGKIIVKYIQQIVGVEVDGVWGLGTLKAVLNYDSKKLFDLLYQKRLTRYEDIVKHNPSQEKFHKGWINRLNAIK